MLRRRTVRERLERMREAAAGQPRRYSHLTKEGGAALREKEASWNAYASAVSRVLRGGACCGEA